MRLGDISNPDAQQHGKPLDGVRVLAAEQMQALPYATQMLARLGADVVKVEHPVHGESGRASTPAMTDPEGRKVGATYLRNNLNKRSLGIDLKTPEGRDLFLALAGRFDVVAENFKAGTMDRMGLGYADVHAVHPRVIYVSISGFGNAVDTPYRDWPAYASIVEAMSGIYEYKSGPEKPPVTIPVGALGDISSALYSVIGILAALRHRDHTGLGQHVDIAMLDAMVAMTDVVTNFWSDGRASGAGQGPRGDLRGVPVLRRLRRHPDRARAPVRGAGRADRPSGVERGPAGSRRARLGPQPRDGDPARGGRVGVAAHEGRGRGRADRGRDRGGTEQLRARRDRRPPRRGAQHARRDAPHRRRRGTRSSSPATR
jgi:hypothetical protein